MSKKRTYTAYLLHFDRPYKHARHYIGITAGPLPERIAAHRNGDGANLTRVIRRAGINFIVARAWPNVPRFTELKLKKQGGASRMCPVCKALNRQEKA